MFNEVTLVGACGQDPELKYSSSGNGYLKFSVATSQNRQVNGEWQSETTWFRVTVFGKQAESLAERLSKGSKVFVKGPVKLSEWEGQDGQKRASLEVIGMVVRSLSSTSDQPTSSPSKNQSPGQLDDDDIPF